MSSQTQELPPPIDLGGTTLRAHLHSGRTVERMHRGFIWAVVPVAAASLLLYGRAAAGVMFFGIAGGVLGEALLRWVVPRGRRAEFEHAALMGLLLSFTLPPVVEGYIPLVGGFVAVVIGKGLLGGVGNYVWHPALVGWASLQLCFGSHLAPSAWPFLASGHLLRGDLAAVSAEPTYRGFDLNPPPPGVEAWSRPRPVDELLTLYRPPNSLRREGSAAGVGVEGGGRTVRLFRDRLPPWGDTLWGTVGGGLGETCTLALVLAGLFLIYLGHGRWQSPLAAMIAVAAISVSVPLHEEAGSSPEWFRFFHSEEGFPVGWAVLLFHLTGDGLALAVLILAADPPTTPLTARGHAVFGFGVGSLTMLARLIGVTPGSGYWAVLLMNTWVPWVDRLTRRKRT